MPAFAFDNSYTRLPERLFAPARPAGASEPFMFAFNSQLAEDLGLDVSWLEQNGAAIFSGSTSPEGAANIAMVYAGHQFGQFNPQLGDGRAMLLGEVVSPQGRRYDIQLKGSGPTLFSRNGDGRAALGPVMREYIVSEAMHALGVPTTRSLAAVATGDAVYRETALPGAVVTRVATSHIRVGTFQYFAARQDVEAVKALADHAIARHYPELEGREHPYLGLLQAVIRRQAALIAKWMGIGFIHGVMNTDNMAISGETIDFGPCAFLDVYSARKVFSSIDRNGRYAYANQPAIGQWNLARLAEALLPLINEDQEAAVAAANTAITGYGEIFQDEWMTVMRAKLGLGEARESDLTLIQSLLSMMEEGQADFTRTFRALYTVAQSDAADAAFRSEFADPQKAQSWLNDWRDRTAEDSIEPTVRAEQMRNTNPAIIPRNHRIEEAIRAAEDDGDFSLFGALHAALADPYSDRPEFERYQAAPLPHEEVPRTFCGT
ncbi:YdiU family protein [Rhizobium sp. L1K21]|uniref:protein adenylyltransferase SelO n=1 Tax=Rhizobium sp. L1K21 TaxID=2954933 RepID=UPI002092C81D|nr:YdiU family protein [Rhizobium sp. L1K21]MCO6185686.1 YdiU family protein [Rhizobium sp. L1K21]